MSTTFIGSDAVTASEQEIQRLQDELAANEAAFSRQVALPDLITQGHLAIQEKKAAHEKKCTQARETYTEANEDFAAALADVHATISTLTQRVQALRALGAQRDAAFRQANALGVGNLIGVRVMDDVPLMLRLTGV